MKGKLTAVLTALLLAFGLQGAMAQKGLKVGAFALPQTTWMLNSTDMDVPQDVFDYQVTYGMASGLMVGYNISDNLGARLNVVYSVQGQSYDAKNADGDWVNYNKRLHYVKVPLMLGFNTNTEFSKIIWTFHAGFQVGFLVHARHTDDDQSYTPDEALYDDIYEYPSDYAQYNAIDYGPVVETGIDIKLTYNVMANLYLRADYSLGDVEDKEAAYKQAVNGIPQTVLIYDANRPFTRHLTGGIYIGLTYTFTEQ